MPKPDTHWTHTRLKEYVRHHKLNKIQVPLSGSKATMVKNLKSAGHWSAELPVTNRRTKAKSPAKPRAKRGHKNMAPGGPKSLRKAKAPATPVTKRRTKKYDN